MAAPCSADTGVWSGTEPIRSGGQVFSIGGAAVVAGTLGASRGL